MLRQVHPTLTLGSVGFRTIVMLTACVLALLADRPVTGYVVQVLPITVQEMVLVGWLLIRGRTHEPRRSPVPAPA